MRLLKCLLAGLLPSCFAPAYAQNPVVIDSLQGVMARSADTTKVKVLVEIAEHYQYDSLSEAERYTRQALALAQQIRWPYGVALARAKMGTLHYYRNDYPRAQAQLLQAVGQLKQRPRDRKYFRCVLSLGGIASETGDSLDAQRWFSLALALAQARRDTADLIRTYALFGQEAVRRQRWERAVDRFTRALPLARAVAQPALEMSMLSDLANVYVSWGKPERALPYLFRALPYAQRTGNKDGIVAITGTLAQAYGALHRPDLALPYALQARRVSVEIQSPTYEQQADTLLANLEAARGNYRAAYRYAQQGAALAQAMFNEAKAKALAEQQTRFQAREREARIRLLDQRNRFQRRLTARETALRNVALAAALLLLLLLAVSASRLRLRRRALGQLAARDREKGLLLQEVHHRVKNNLQIVLSLLNAQLLRLPDPAAAQAIRESQSRVRAMALIHQTLYQSESLARVDMRRYLTQLVDALRRSFRQQARGVVLVLDVAAVELTPHTAVPLGLVVNELLTNAFKYAFPPHRAGAEPPTLRVVLRPLGADETYELEVADNGVGLPAGVDEATAATLGLRLVGGFVTQLQGAMTVERAGGTRFCIAFGEAAPVADAAPAESPYPEVQATS